MLTATDSFIQYLASGLSGIVSVHWRRQDASDENASMLRLDALNVQYLGFFEDGSIEQALVSLDLLGSDERTVLGQLRDLRDLLLSVQMVQERDFTDPLLPLPTGRTVSWDGRETNFLSVRVPRGQRYVHYNATFPLKYTRE